MKAAWLGAVDGMVGRLAARLAASPHDPAPSFVLAATGDHSTPALFGDHSVEPVPFAASTVRAVAASLGGGGRLERVYGRGPARIDPVPADPAGPPLSSWGGAPPPPTFPPPPAFDEAAAAAGCLGRFPGREVMPLLARLASTWGRGW